MLHRRDAMIRMGQVGLGALTLPGLLRAQHTAAPAPAATGGKAKACILVYLWGGPPQQDMFDMKPTAPDGVRSQFQPISTRVPGIQVCDEMPLLAQHTDKMAIIRSLTHPSNTHEVGVYHTLAGKINNTLVVPRNQRNRHDFPNMSGIVSKFTPPGNMPASVTIPRPIGHSGVTYTGTYAGFLGPRFDPLEMLPPATVNTTAPHNLDLPPNLTDNDLILRQGLLEQLETFQQAVDNPAATQSLDAAREQAFRMLTSPEAKRAFKLDLEPDSLRDRYGRNEYGEAFLLSRRLIESGVKLVTLTWYHVCPNGVVANVWDNHGGTGALGNLTGYQMLRAFYCLPSLDRGLSALLEDLDARGLLDETVIAMFGEFGRTPRINNTAGRDHWGPCQTAVMAGGGIQGGQTYGASDSQAAYPTANPVKPEDIHATIYHAMGLSPDLEIHDPEGRPHRITEGTAIMRLF